MIGLLQSNDYTAEIQSKLIQSSKLLVLSAYVTTPGVKWLTESINDNCSATIIARMSKSDFSSNSTNIEGIRFALDNNIEVKMHRSIHAKIFLIDDKDLFVGSANLTNNGLSLFGQGNLEIGTHIHPRSRDLELLKSVNVSSISVSYEILDEIEGAIADSNCQNFSSRSFECYYNSDQLWVSDFFWKSLSDLNKIDFHDRDLLDVYSLSSEMIEENLLSLPAINWLIRTLNESGTVYFGQLSQALHDSLHDNPAPYRKTVKLLLSNLLEYVEEYLSDYIRIDRPNYSQRIALVQQPTGQAKREPPIHRTKELPRNNKRSYR